MNRRREFSIFLNKKQPQRLKQVISLFFKALQPYWRHLERLRIEYFKFIDRLTAFFRQISADFL
jgi:hypothetical protein